MVKIKICGITNTKDAIKAIELGANALGFIFASSPRQVTPEKTTEIIRQLPPFITTVGVFVNESPEIIKTIAQDCGLDRIQLHGNENPDICAELMPMTIKALRVKDNSIYDQAIRYKGYVKALLLDTYIKGKAGGTGETFNWDFALRVKETEIPVILAGGLSPSNIIDAISSVKPYAVDISSGVEESPGNKDHALMEKLFEKINIIRRQESEYRSQ